MSEGDERRAYRLSGRVQGVGFRWWTRQTAGGLGLRGTVRNDPDGTVEIRVSGPSAALDELESRLRDGPGPARVDDLRPIEPGEDPLPSGFEIVR